MRSGVRFPAGTFFLLVGCVVWWGHCFGEFLIFFFLECVICVVMKNRIMRVSYVPINNKKYAYLVSPSFSMLPNNVSVKTSDFSPERV